MRDIESREDIDTLLIHFYQKALKDDTIGYIFQNAPGFHLETHLPVIASFWENVLFANAVYKGNPMLKHIELNKVIPLNAGHFKRWLLLWEETVTTLFQGRIAADAVTKAKSIAYLMEQKIGIANSNGKGSKLM